MLFFKKSRKNFFSLALVASSILSFCAVNSVAAAENPAQKNIVWPSRSIKIVVGFSAGSTPDITARILALPLSKALGQSVIVENRPGASGNIAADVVAKASDDHTLGIVINGNLTSAKMLYPQLPYDPAKDFAPISLLTQAPLVLVAPANLPGGAAFFAAAINGGNTWNYGSVGIGSVAHLGMELLKSKTPGLLPLQVPFPGNPQVITAMLGGQLQMALIGPGVAMPQVRSGKLRAIGLTSGRSALAPEVPSLQEAGGPNLQLEVWNALVGPARLPLAAQARLAEIVPQILRDPEIRQQLFNQGWQAVGSSPEGLKTRIKDETRLLGNIIKTRGIKLE
jgi:tripartite-type tricarboxylate transporter receptor subunit TctC